MAERYGVKVLGHYLTMRGTVVNYPTYPWETPEAAKARAKSAVLKKCKWVVVDSRDYPVETNK
jgi:hypothetical protein